MISDVSPAVKVMEIVKRSNDISKHLRFCSFYNDAINEDFPTRTDYARYKKSISGSFSFSQYHFLLDPAVKSKILQIDSFTQMGQEYRNARMASIFDSRTSPYLNLVVERETIVKDTLFQLQREEEFKKPLRVKFKGEDGVDEGGVQKEFFQLIIRQLFQREYGMFEYSEDTRLY